MGGERTFTLEVRVRLAFVGCPQAALGSHRLGIFIVRILLMVVLSLCFYLKPVIPL